MVMAISTSLVQPVAPVLISGSRPCRIMSCHQRNRTALVRAAGQDPIVTYILVNPAIKKAMCRREHSGSTFAPLAEGWTRDFLKPGVLARARIHHRNSEGVAVCISAAL